MGFEIEYPQTHNTPERCSNSLDFKKDNDYEFPIRVDPAPDNNFNSVFAAWPLRFYVISPESIVQWIAEPFGDLMLVSSLIKYLKTILL